MYTTKCSCLPFVLHTPGLGIIHSILSIDQSYITWLFHRGAKILLLSFYHHTSFSFVSFTNNVCWNSLDTSWVFFRKNRLFFSIRSFVFPADFLDRSERLPLGAACRLTYHKLMSTSLITRSLSSCRNSLMGRSLRLKERMGSSSLRVLRLLDTVCFIVHLIDLNGFSS